MSSLIVGLGRRGHFHLEAMSVYPALRPTYVLDPRLPGTTTAGAGVEIVTSLDAARRVGPLELIVVCTPPPTHVQYVVDVAALDARILLEKPSATSAEEILRLRSLPRSLRERVFVGYSERFNPRTLEARTTLTGTIRSRQLRQVTFRRFRPMAQMGEDAESAGAELSVHDLDFMLNHVEPAGAFDLSITESAGGAFRATGTIGGVPTEFRSGWTDAENITEAVVTELDGSIRVIDLSSGGRPGRIAALRHQLSHVLGAAGSDDLSKDERVLGVFHRS